MMADVCDDTNQVKHLAFTNTCTLELFDFLCLHAKRLWTENIVK